MLRGKRFALSIATLLLLTLFHLAITPPVSGSSSECSGLGCEQTDDFSQVVVLREATAIWCEVCAVADPIIADFVDERGKQVSHIALHPDDGVDMLGNQLSTQQVFHLGGNPQDLEYPTIWMGDSAPRAGMVEGSDLHKQFLADAGRQRGEISVQTTNSGDSASSSDFFTIGITATLPSIPNGTYTFIVTEDEVEVDNPESYNGIRYHNGVARAGVILNSSSGEVDFSEPSESWVIGDFIQNDETVSLNITFHFPSDGEWAIDKSKLTAIAEDVNDKIVAASTTPQQVSAEESGGLSTIIAVAGVGLAGVVLAIPASKSKNSQKTKVQESPGAESEE